MASIDSLPPSPKTRVSPFGSRQYPAACRGKNVPVTVSVTCPPPPAQAPGLGALSTGGGADPWVVEEVSLLHPPTTRTTSSSGSPGLIRMGRFTTATRRVEQPRPATPHLFA